MDAVTAQSLVAHINGNSTRFSAFSMNFSERTWVILCDSKAPRTSPCEQPILDVREFVERLEKRSPRSVELHALLQCWVQSCLEEKRPDWQANVTSSRPPVMSAVESGMRRL